MKKIFTLIVIAVGLYGNNNAQMLTPDQQSSLSNQAKENYYYTPTNSLKGIGTCFAHPDPIGSFVFNCGGAAASIALEVAENNGKVIWTDNNQTALLGAGILNYNAPVIDSNFFAYAYPGSDIVISEISLDPDFVEITNVSNGTINTEGWFVVASNDYSLISVANSVVWYLPDSIAPGQVLFRDDDGASAQYWGANLYFDYSPASNCWVMIVDNCGNIVDALFHGWQKTDIQSLSVTAGGFLLEPETEWLGNGTDPTVTTFSIERAGNSDNQFVSDFITYGASGSQTAGTLNPIMSIPYSDITEINIPMANMNGHRGIMYNVVADVDLQIESFSPYVTMAAGDSVKIYYRSGNYVNFSTSLSGWTYAGSNVFTASTSGSVTTHVPVGNIFIPAGDTMAIYIHVTSVSSTTQYSDGIVALSDGNITALNGAGMDYPGGSVFQPRYYIGNIQYSLGRQLNNNNAIYSVRNEVNAELFSQTDNNCTGAAIGSVDSIIVNEIDSLDLGLFDHDFSGSGMTRGYGFTAPTNMIIHALKVPEMAVANEVQNIQVVRFDAAYTTFTTLYYGNNLTPNNWIDVDLTINQGEIIGIIGARGTTTMHNAYGPIGPFASTIAGQALNLDRLYYQDNLNSTQIASGNIGTETGGSIAQVDMIYSYQANSNCLYEWSTGATTELITDLAAGTYTVTATNVTGCSNTLDVVIADGSPSPVIDLGIDSVLCADESYTLDAGAGYASYNWATGDIANTVTLDTALLGLGSFSVWVVVTDANGCEGTDTVVVTFEICSEINTPADWNVNLYPNPNNGTFELNLEGIAGLTTVSITNLSGQVIEMKQIDANSVSSLDMDLRSYGQGVYFVNITNGQGSHVLKMIVE